MPAGCYFSHARALKGPWSACSTFCHGVTAPPIGFGAYESDYGFFMDGGTESRAWSEERLTANLDRIARTLTDQNADFYLVQEVDIDSTRSYHVDEREPLYAALSWENSVFCQNYDSPYLMYPLTKPHGASRSGLLTFAPAKITSARRVELPVESGFMKLLDLDRCYSVSRIPVDGGRELVLYNLHLSAYTSNGTIATEQLSLLLRDMQREYEKGNWCVAGGDFNKDLLGDSTQLPLCESGDLFTPRLLVAAEELLGTFGKVLVGIAVSCAVLSGIMGFYLASSRLMYSMSRDGFLPPAFGKIDKRYGTPKNAMIFCILISLSGPILGREALGWFVDMSAIGASIGYLATCAATLVTLRRDGDGTPFLKAMAVTGVVFSVIFIVLQLIPIPWLSGVHFGKESYLMLIVWVAIGAVFYIKERKSFLKA